MRKILDSSTIIFSSIIFILSCNSNSDDKRADNTPAKDTTAKPSYRIGATLALKEMIPLPSVKGGFDLMAVDLKGGRLFVSAEDNHSLEVIDLKNHQPIYSITGLDEPKWVAYHPTKKRIYVATGGDGKVTEINDINYKVVKIYSFKEKCNNLRFDPLKKYLLVGVGNTFGAIGIIDVDKSQIIGQIPLSGYPKQFEIDSNLIYANIPKQNIVEVVDWVKKKQVSTWQVNEAKENVPMALDKDHKRLFVACEPGKFIIYSTDTHTSIASLDISLGADGIYYDAKRKHIYISCGEGSINVIQQVDPDHYQLLEKIDTYKGAGTSLFSNELSELFLAVPQAGNQKASIQIYQPKD